MMQLKRKHMLHVTNYQIQQYHLWLNSVTCSKTASEHQPGIVLYVKEKYLFYLFYRGHIKVTNGTKNPSLQIDEALETV